MPLFDRSLTLSPRKRAAVFCAVSALLASFWFAARNHPEPQAPASKVARAIPDEPPRLAKGSRWLQQMPSSSLLFVPWRQVDPDFDLRPLLMVKVSDHSDFETKVNPWDQPISCGTSISNFNRTQPNVLTREAMYDLVGVRALRTHGAEWIKFQEERRSFGYCGNGYRSKFGETRETRDAIDRALHWLALHQNPDGHWDAGAPASDVTQTSLAVLAYLGADYNHTGLFNVNVQRATDWLKSQQQSDGRFGDATPKTFTELYPTVLAALALGQAAWVDESSDTNFAAFLAADYCMEKIERGTIGWHSIKDETDFMFAGWYVQLLKAAKAYWIETDYCVQDQIAQFCNEATLDVGIDPNDKQDVPVLRYGLPETRRDEMRTYSARTWAVGIFARQYLGDTKSDLKRSVTALIGQFGNPGLNSDPKKVDLENWYFGSFSAFQQGDEIWRQWNAGLQNALICTQIVKKHDRDFGSWDPVGYNAKARGRVGQTALSALCLEIYYPAARMVTKK